jgi:hypothetical protein
MSNFRVLLISPPGYVHSEALREVAETLMYGLRSLSHQAEIASSFAPGAIHIVLCPHLLSSRSQLPQGTILYNFEQLGAPHLESLMHLARHYPVWDYSARNMKQWPIRIAPIEVPLGYVKELNRIDSAPEQDIDVLFYGSINRRRRTLVERLHRAGLKVMTLFGTYGAERDRMIARSKLVLNMHYYPTQIFEVVRVSYLLTNSKAVVAECDDSTEIDKEMRSAVACVPYELLRDKCVELVRNQPLRRGLEIRGHIIFSKRSEKEILRTALEKTYAPNPTFIECDASDATIARAW